MITYQYIEANHRDMDFSSQIFIFYKYIISFWKIKSMKEKEINNKNNKKQLISVILQEVLDSPQLLTFTILAKKTQLYSYACINIMHYHTFSNMPFMNADNFLVIKKFPAKMLPTEMLLHFTGILCPHYKSRGCWRDPLPSAVPSKRPMNTYAMNERDPRANNWNGRLINWRKWGRGYLAGLLCRCAKVAKQTKKRFFSIQFYGIRPFSEEIDINKIVKCFP